MWITLAVCIIAYIIAVAPLNLAQARCDRKK